ncbi:hypothetical protein KIPB_001530, partial [Kipferlia bialata]|eukprot:g1530.t1
MSHTTFIRVPQPTDAEKALADATHPVLENWDYKNATIGSMFRMAVDNYGDAMALGERPVQEDGEFAPDYQWRSYTQMGIEVDEISKVLDNVGVAIGDRVGIFADNSPRWTESDLAIKIRGAITAASRGFRYFVAVVSVLAVITRSPVCNWYLRGPEVELTDDFLGICHISNLWCISAANRGRKVFSVLAPLRKEFLYILLQLTDRTFTWMSSPSPWPIFRMQQRMKDSAGPGSRSNTPTAPYPHMPLFLTMRGDLSNTYIRSVRSMLFGDRFPHSASFEAFEDMEGGALSETEGEGEGEAEGDGDGSDGDNEERTPGPAASTLSRLTSFHLVAGDHSKVSRPPPAAAASGEAALLSLLPTCSNEPVYGVSPLRDPLCGEAPVSHPSRLFSSREGMSVPETLQERERDTKREREAESEALVMTLKRKDALSQMSTGTHSSLMRTVSTLVRDVLDEYYHHVPSSSDSSEASGLMCVPLCFCIVGAYGTLDPVSMLLSLHPRTLKSRHNERAYIEPTATKSPSERRRGSHARERRAGSRSAKYDVYTASILDRLFQHVHTRSTSAPPASGPLGAMGGEPEMDTLAMLQGRCGLPTGPFLALSAMLIDITRILYIGCSSPSMPPLVPIELGTEGGLPDPRETLLTPRFLQLLSDAVTVGVCEDTGDGDESAPPQDVCVGGSLVVRERQRQRDFPRLRLGETLEDVVLLPTACQDILACMYPNQWLDYTSLGNSYTNMASLMRAQAKESGEGDAGGESEYTARDYVTYDPQTSPPPLPSRHSPESATIVATCLALLMTLAVPRPANPYHSSAHTVHKRDTFELRFGGRRGQHGFGSSSGDGLPSYASPSDRERERERGSSAEGRRRPASREGEAETPESLLVPITSPLVANRHFGVPLYVEDRLVHHPALHSPIPSLAAAEAFTPDLFRSVQKSHGIGSSNASPLSFVFGDFISSYLDRTSSHLTVPLHLLHRVPVTTESAHRQILDTMLGALLGAPPPSNTGKRGKRDTKRDSTSLYVGAASDSDPLSGRFTEGEREAQRALIRHKMGSGTSIQQLLLDMVTCYVIETPKGESTILSSCGVLGALLSGSFYFWGESNPSQYSSELWFVATPDDSTGPGRTDREDSDPDTLSIDNSFPTEGSTSYNPDRDRGGAVETMPGMPLGEGEPERGRDRERERDWKDVQSMMASLLDSVEYQTDISAEDWPRVPDPNILAFSSQVPIRRVRPPSQTDSAASLRQGVLELLSFAGSLPSTSCVSDVVEALLVVINTVPNRLGSVINCCSTLCEMAAGRHERVRDTLLQLDALVVLFRLLDQVQLIHQQVQPGQPGYHLVQLARHEVLSVIDIIVDGEEGLTRLLDDRTALDIVFGLLTDVSLRKWAVTLLGRVILTACHAVVSLTQAPPVEPSMNNVVTSLLGGSVSPSSLGEGRPLSLKQRNEEARVMEAAENRLGMLAAGIIDRIQRNAGESPGVACALIEILCQVLDGSNTVVLNVNGGRVDTGMRDTSVRLFQDTLRSHSFFIKLWTTVQVTESATLTSALFTVVRHLVAGNPQSKSALRRAFVPTDVAELLAKSGERERVRLAGSEGAVVGSVLVSHVQLLLNILVEDKFTMSGYQRIRTPCILGSLFAVFRHPACAPFVQHLILDCLESLVEISVSNRSLCSKEGTLMLILAAINDIDAVRYSEEDPEGTGTPSNDGEDSETEESSQEDDQTSAVSRSPRSTASFSVLSSSPDTQPFTEPVVVVNAVKYRNPMDVELGGYHSIQSAAGDGTGMEGNVGAISMAAVSSLVDGDRANIRVGERGDTFTTTLFYVDPNAQQGLVDTAVCGMFGERWSLEADDRAVTANGGTRNQPTLLIRQLGYLASIVGVHSVHELKRVLKLLRVEDDGYRSPHMPLILRALQRMSREAGPRSCFDLDGKQSGIQANAPTPVSVFAHGLSLFLWVRVSSLLDPLGRPLYKPRVMSLLTKDGLGVEVYLDENGSLVMRSVGMRLGGNLKRPVREELTVLLDARSGHEWSVGIWRHLGVSIKATGKGQADVVVYVNGKQVASESAFYPMDSLDIDDTLLLTIGTNRVVDHVQHRESRLLRSSGLICQATGIVLLDGPSKQDQAILMRDTAAVGLSLFLLRSQGRGALTETDNPLAASSESSDPTQTGSPGDRVMLDLQRHVVLALYPEATEDGTNHVHAVAVGPEATSHACFNQGCSILPGTCVLSNRSIRELLTCVGGVQSLFPLLQQLSFPPRPPPGGALSADPSGADTGLVVCFYELLNGLLRDSASLRHDMAALSFRIPSVVLEGTSPQSVDAAFVSVLRNMVNSVKTRGPRELVVSLLRSHVYNAATWLWTSENVLKQVADLYITIPRLQLSLSPKVDIKEVLLESIGFVDMLDVSSLVLYYEPTQRGYPKTVLQAPPTTGWTAQRPRPAALTPFRRALLASLLEWVSTPSSPSAYSALPPEAFSGASGRDAAGCLLGLVFDTPDDYVARCEYTAVLSQLLRTGHLPNQSLMGCLCSSVYALPSLDLDPMAQAAEAAGPETGGDRDVLCGGLEGLIPTLDDSSAAPPPEAETVMATPTELSGLPAVSVICGLFLQTLAAPSLTLHQKSYDVTVGPGWSDPRQLRVYRTLLLHCVGGILKQERMRVRQVGEEHRQRWTSGEAFDSVVEVRDSLRAYNSSESFVGGPGEIGVISALYQVGLQCVAADRIGAQNTEGTVCAESVSGLPRVDYDARPLELFVDTLLHLSCDTGMPHIHTTPTSDLGDATVHQSLQALLPPPFLAHLLRAQPATERERISVPRISVPCVVYLLVRLLPRISCPLLLSQTLFKLRLLCRDPYNAYVLSGVPNAVDIIMALPGSHIDRTTAAEARRLRKGDPMTQEDRDERARSTATLYCAVVSLSAILLHAEYSLQGVDDIVSRLSQPIIGLEGDTTPQRRSTGDSQSNKGEASPETAQAGTLPWGDVYCECNLRMAVCNAVLDHILDESAPYRRRSSASSLSQMDVDIQREKRIQRDETALVLILCGEYFREGSPIDFRGVYNLGESAYLSRYTTEPLPSCTPSQVLPRGLGALGSDRAETDGGRGDMYRSTATHQWYQLPAAEMEALSCGLMRTLSPSLDPSPHSLHLIVSASDHIIRVMHTLAGNIYAEQRRTRDLSNLEAAYGHMVLSDGMRETLKQYIGSLVTKHAPNISLRVDALPAHLLLSGVPVLRFGSGTSLKKYLGLSASLCGFDLLDWGVLKDVTSADTPFPSIYSGTRSAVGDSDYRPQIPTHQLYQMGERDSDVSFTLFSLLVSALLWSSVETGGPSVAESESERSEDGDDVDTLETPSNSDAPSADDDVTVDSLSSLPDTVPNSPSVRRTSLSVLGLPASPRSESLADPAPSGTMLWKTLSQEETDRLCPMTVLFKHILAYSAQSITQQLAGYLSEDVRITTLVATLRDTAKENSPMRVYEAVRVRKADVWGTVLCMAAVPVLQAVYINLSQLRHSEAEHARHTPSP